MIQVEGIRNINKVLSFAKNICQYVQPKKYLSKSANDHS